MRRVSARGIFQGAYGGLKIPFDTPYPRDIIAQFVFPEQDKAFLLWHYLQVLTRGLKHVKE